MRAAYRALVRPAASAAVGAAAASSRSKSSANIGLLRAEAYLRKHVQRLMTGGSRIPRDGAAQRRSIAFEDGPLEAEQQLVYAGNEILRQPALPVPEEMFAGGELIEIVADMIQAMRDAPGVGLAAPQVGINWQIIVLEERAELLEMLDEGERDRKHRRPFGPLALVNPQLRPIGSAGARFMEGCLSVPGYMALVERYLEVDVEAMSPMGDPIRFRAHGWQARILQHEVDHLRGMLYVDRMLPRSFVFQGTPKQVPPDVPLEGSCRCSHEL